MSALPLRAAAGPAPISETVVEPRLTDGDEGDHDRFAHYVRKDDIVRSAVEGVAVVALSYITGEAIEALCGKKWIPNRDPEKYPVCPSCKEILATLRAAR